MKLPARLVAAFAIIGVVGAAAAGAASGIALANRTNAPGHHELAITDPNSAARNTAALRSAGGFTGFDGAATLGGQVVRTGKMGATQNGAFEVTTSGSTLAIRSTAPTRLFRIMRARAPLAPGDVVQVRTQESGTAAGVLRLPGDLHEGENRGPAAGP